MDDWGSKSGRLYDEIRQSLQSGLYAPGARIDLTALARQFHASATPVRHALYRLVGEGLVEDHARDGFFVPPVTEWLLRDLYGWVQDILIAACDSIARSPRISEWPTGSRRGNDTVLQTRELFEEIALTNGSFYLTEAVRRANARLEVVRKTEIQLLDDTPKELVSLHRLWRNQEMDALKAALAAYHERRRHLVPRLVAALGVKSHHGADWSRLPAAIACHS